MRITDTFYTMPATKLAPAMLGKLLCVKQGAKTLKYRITETECYYGEEDSACYAHKGKTKRALPLYEQGGKAYVSLVYGMHHMINIVSGPEGHPESVLIRGVEGFDGPGKLTKAMGITRDLHGVSLITSDIIWLEDDGCSPAFKTTPRIGIGYAAAEDQLLPWRFITN